METNLIINRRREVQAQIERMKASITELESELAELQTAERVFARLSRAKRTPARAADEQPPQDVTSEKKAEPPLTEKIRVVLAEAHRRGQKGLEPMGIYDAILEKGWSATKDNVRTTTWRLWNEDRLGKVSETRLYTVPGREEADDDLLGEATSSASDVQPDSMRPVKPEPGGAH